MQSDLKSYKGPVNTHGHSYIVSGFLDEITIHVKGSKERKKQIKKGERIKSRVEKKLKSNNPINEGRNRRRLKLYIGQVL